MIALCGWTCRADDRVARAIEPEAGTWSVLGLRPELGFALLGSFTWKFYLKVLLGSSIWKFYVEFFTWNFIWNFGFGIVYF